MVSDWLKTNFNQWEASITGNLYGSSVTLSLKLNNTGLVLTNKDVFLLNQKKWKKWVIDILLLMPGVGDAAL